MAHYKRTLGSLAVLLLVVLAITARYPSYDAAIRFALAEAIRLHPFGSVVTKPKFSVDQRSYRPKSPKGITICVFRSSGEAFASK